jgi:hypothetical protein
LCASAVSSSSGRSTQTPAITHAPLHGFEPFDLHWKASNKGYPYHCLDFKSMQNRGSCPQWCGHLVVFRPSAYPPHVLRPGGHAPTGASLGRAGSTSLGRAGSPRQRHAHAPLGQLWWMMRRWRRAGGSRVGRLVGRLVTNLLPRCTRARGRTRGEDTSLPHSRRCLRGICAAGARCLFFITHS